MISVHGLRMAFDGIEVVKGVDLELRGGEVHAIVGENGAGKSTVAKVMAGVYRPSSGWVEISGERVELGNPREALVRGVALIHQEPLTFPDLDVAENIFVGHQPVHGLGGIDWRQMRSKADDILASLGVRLRATSKVRDLSVADQQMVELAAALSHNAKVLLMDETTAALTPKETDELFTIVRKLRDAGCAIAFVSHRLEEVFAIADRITVMRDGEKVGERIPSESSVGEIVRMMVGREIAGGGSGTSASDSAEVILRVSDLSAPGLFTNVSFELRAGEILGLAGLVGAGRTDVCRALFGLLPSTGLIEVGGHPVRIRNPRHAMSLGMALVPEDRQHEGLLMPQSIALNGALPSLKGGWLGPRREESVVLEAIKKLQTAFRSVSQPVRELSGGNQQKVVLAKWLLTKPRILILDEPTRGVDVGAKEEVHRVIRSLADEGVAVLMVSSDLPEVLALSDRVLVMRSGRLAGVLDRSEADQEKVMQMASGVPVPVGEP